MKLNKQAPNKSFDIEVNGEVRTIKMTYGLFNEVMRLVPSPDTIADLLVTDATLRDLVVRRVLTEKREVNSTSDLVDPFDLDLDMDALDELVAWIAEHVLHFFMKAAVKTAKIGTRYQDSLADLKKTLPQTPSNP